MLSSKENKAVVKDLHTFIMQPVIKDWLASGLEATNYTTRHQLTSRYTGALKKSHGALPSIKLTIKRLLELGYVFNVTTKKKSITWRIEPGKLKEPVTVDNLYFDLVDKLTPQLTSVPDTSKEVQKFFYHYKSQRKMLVDFTPKLNTLLDKFDEIGNRVNITMTQNGASMEVTFMFKYDIASYNFKANVKNKFEKWDVRIREIMSDMLKNEITNISNFSARTEKNIRYAMDKFLHRPLTETELTYIRNIVVNSKSSKVPSYTTLHRTANLLKLSFSIDTKEEIGNECLLINIRLTNDKKVCNEKSLYTVFTDRINNIVYAERRNGIPLKSLVGKDKWTHLYRVNEGGSLSIKTVFDVHQELTGYNHMATAIDDHTLQLRFYKY